MTVPTTSTGPIDTSTRDPDALSRMPALMRTITDKKTVITENIESQRNLTIPESIDPSLQIIQVARERSDLRSASTNLVSITGGTF